MSKEAMKRAVDKIKSTFWEGYVPEPDKRQQALDKKAENARELGLDYEPIQCPVCKAEDSPYPKCGCVIYVDEQRAWFTIDELNAWADKKLKENPRWAEQPAQQEPVALKWQQAPVKTQWGGDMVVASVAIDKDHTLSLYCERDQAPKVDAMFAQRKPLTDDEIWREYRFLWPFHPAEERKLASDILMFARAIEAAHGIKENT